MEHEGSFEINISSASGELISILTLLLFFIVKKYLLKPLSSITETSYFTDSDHPNIRLLADAPELLADNKRLRIWKEAFEHYMGKTEAKQYVMEYKVDEEE